MAGVARGGDARKGGRVAGWARHHIPTREGIERNRWLKPVSHRILVPSLWRFNRRSVPRGVTLGLFCGVIFPFAHMPSAAILAVPARANIPIAVGITIPSTFLIPGYWWAAHRIGRWILRLDRVVPGQPIATNVDQHAGWLHWLVSQEGPSMIVGLLALALSLSATGHVVASFGWRWRTARKWRNRHACRTK
ncbi:DUF2062 domain-containing protein [Sphingomonas bacterium]|uniref:DUF2062 domain-containing protein n=1 Tax=Sphingomonas bacterium TaxID=1895847 RepID=UPI0015766CCF|nr:DUF2062 domain-containing protein [Sphingomonas bacterium]